MIELANIVDSFRSVRLLSLRSDEVCLDGVASHRYHFLKN